MPRQPQFKVEAIETLFEQLRYAPVETKRRQMDAAEQLIYDIEPQENYPVSFVIYRITAYRPDAGAEDTLLVGEALRPDLITFVQRLSAALDWTPEEAGREAIPIDVVAERLGVSASTLRRYRRQGLVCHHLRFEDGARLVCFADALERFRQDNELRLAEAGRFTRVEAEDRNEMIDAARTMRGRSSISLNEAARRLARRHGRAPETVRRILQQHDAASAQPIFTERGPLTDHEQRLIERAYRLGFSAGELSRRFGRSRKTVHRVIQAERAARLLEFDLSWVTLPTFDLPEAETVLLSPPAVRQRLDEPALPRDGVELIRQLKAMEELSGEDEDALVAAYNLLKRRADRQRRELAESPSAEAIDNVETDLRWADLLKRKLVVHGWPTALRVVELTLHRPLLQSPTSEILRLMELAVHVVSQTIESLDPSRDQRLARRVDHAMDRALAARDLGGGGRASARHEAGSMPLPGDPLRRVTRWGREVSPGRELIEHLRGVDAEDAALVQQRFGWLGDPPQLMSSLARERRTTVTAVRRTLRRALRDLRNAARVTDAGSAEPWTGRGDA